MLRGLAIAVVWLVPVWVAGAVIDVRDKVTVSEGTLLRLKDVARISDADPIKAAALGEITLSPAPAAGRSQRFGFEDLRHRLQSHGINLTEIEFRGQAVATVTTSSPSQSRPTRPEPRTIQPQPQPAKITKLQQQQADQLVQLAVQRAFRLNATEALPVRVTCACEPEDVPLILATSSDRIRFAEPQLQVGPPQAVTAHWQSADGTPQSIVVQVAVDLAPRRLAVRHPVPAGYPLQPDDLEWVTGEIDPEAITQLADAVGKETKRTLRAGEQLSADMLTTSPLIRSNDIVTVQVRRPGVTVRRMFKAMSSGVLNDTVMLVAIDDPRLRVKGIVTGYHEATIVESPAVPASAPSREERP